jgi:hypothetical protein
MDAFSFALRPSAVRKSPAAWLSFWSLGVITHMTQVGHKRLTIALGIALVLLLFYTFLNYLAEFDVSLRVRTLQSFRDDALKSDVPKAAEILKWVSMEQPSDSQTMLEQIHRIQWTNSECDIITYLRAKTGEDLGSDPQPWIEKYAPKK